MLCEHPARREIVGEMHLRRWPLVGPGMRLVQIVRLVDPNEEAEEQSALFARGAVVRGSCEAGRRHFSATLSERVRLTWERHSEASTLSLFADAGADELDAAVAGNGNQYIDASPFGYNGGFWYLRAGVKF